MRVLVLSSVFPNAKEPDLGVFVRERVRRVARHCHLVVVAPVPWFPGNRLIRGPLYAGVPRCEEEDAVRVYHPRFLCVPHYLKCLDGVLYAASLLPFLLRLRKRFPFDLIDAHFAYPDGLAGALLGNVFGCPVVITLRGSIVRLATYRTHLPQLRFALASAARVLSVSESLKRAAVELGISAEKIRVVPNGVDPTRFRPMDRAAARRGLGLPLDRTVLLSVGGLLEGKGQHRIVALLPRLLRRRPDLLYAVVGSGRRGDPGQELVERLIADHGLQGHVLLAGQRPHQEIPWWFGAADLFCLATRSEGWSNVLLEAIACGRPVVSTRVGGNPEIVRDESLGLLVPPADDDALERAILFALDRPWDPEALAARARAHSWEAAAAAIVEEFQRVAPGGLPEACPQPGTATGLSRGGR